MVFRSFFAGGQNIQTKIGDVHNFSFGNKLKRQENNQKVKPPSRRIGSKPLSKTLARYVIVRYKFDVDVDDIRKEAFRAAAADWRAVSCIAVIEDPDAETWHSERMMGVFSLFIVFFLNILLNFEKICDPHCIWFNKYAALFISLLKIHGFSCSLNELTCFFRRDRLLFVCSNCDLRASAAAVFVVLRRVLTF